MVLSGISERFNKPLLVFAKFFRKFGLTPTHLTLIGLLLSVLAGYWYYRYTPETRWWPFMLLLLAGFFDALDGVMARNFSMTSKLGGIMDSTADRLGESIVFLGLILGGAVNAEWGLLALIFSLMVSYVRARSEGEGLHLKGRGFAERPERLIILLAATLANKLELGIAVIAILSLITMCQRIYHLYASSKTA